MLDITKVTQHFSFFSDLTGEELAHCHGLCERALAGIERRLRPEYAQPQGENVERLCMAAAAEAYADYVMLKSGSQSAADELRVGDISLKSGTNSAGGGGTEIRDYFLAKAADLLEPEYVAFAGVEA